MQTTEYTANQAEDLCSCSALKQIIEEESLDAIRLYPLLRDACEAGGIERVLAYHSLLAEILPPISRFRPDGLYEATKKRVLARLNEYIATSKRQKEKGDAMSTIADLANKPLNHDTAADDISDQDILDYAVEVMDVEMTSELETAILAAGQQPLRGQVETCGDAMCAIVEAGQHDVA